MTQSPSVFRFRGKKKEEGKAFLWIVLIVAGLIIVIPPLLRYGTSPTSQAGMDVLNIVNGQDTFFSSVGQGCYAAGLSDLLQASMIEVQLGSETKAGYVFALVTDDEGKTFTISARPEEYGATGRRSYLANQVGVVRSTDENRSADSDDPPLLQ